MSLHGQALVDAAVKAAVDKKAIDIVILDTRKSQMADFVIICQGENTFHCKAIGEEISVQLKKLNTPPWQSEGLSESRWVLLDYTDVIIHILVEELRDFYNLENIHKDAAQRTVAEDGSYEPF